jgi:hypothetical protein
MLWEMAYAFSAVDRALLLSACASKPTGNEFGGVVMNGGTRADAAFRQA